jgi:DNA-binding MarR family transcriptional regulator
VNQAVRTRMERALREYDLTLAQYAVMSLLVGKDGISSAKIARARRVSPQSMNEQIVALEGRGLVARLGDPDNRRELLVSLTKPGRDKLKACDGVVDQIERDLFTDVDATAHNDLRTVLVTLIGTIRRADGV